MKSYFEDDGSFVPCQTTFQGLFEQSKEFGNKPPFELTESYIKARTRINMDTPYNMVAATDASGGNSGSPLVNRKCEFVGILFDGNRQSLPHRFLYSDKQTRAVMVHAHGILEALNKIYDAKPLINELLGK